MGRWGNTVPGPCASGSVQAYGAGSGPMATRASATVAGVGEGDGGGVPRVGRIRWEVGRGVLCKDDQAGLLHTYDLPFYNAHGGACPGNQRGGCSELQILVWWVRRNFPREWHRGFL